MGLNEVHHRAIAQTVNDVAGGAAGDGADGKGGGEVRGVPEPNGKAGDDGKGDGGKDDEAEGAEAVQHTEGDAMVPDQHEVENRQQDKEVAVLQVKRVEDGVFAGLVGGEDGEAEEDT